MCNGFSVVSDKMVDFYIHFLIEKISELLVATELRERSKGLVHRYCPL